MKQFASRFGESPAESAQVHNILKRVGILFLALGLLFLLISKPKGDMTPEHRGQMTLLEIACGFTAFWQVRGIMGEARSQRGDSRRITRKR